MAVSLAAGKVGQDRLAHMFGNAEAEQPGIADIQLDDVAPLGLELGGTPGEVAADLIADFGNPRAGAHGRNGAVARHRVRPDSDVVMQHASSIASKYKG